MRHFLIIIFHVYIPVNTFHLNLIKNMITPLTTIDLLSKKYFILSNSELTTRYGILCKKANLTFVFFIF